MAKRDVRCFTQTAKQGNKLLIKKQYTQYSDFTLDKISDIEIRFSQGQQREIVKEQRKKPNELRKTKYNTDIHNINVNMWQEIFSSNRKQ